MVGRMMRGDHGPETSDLCVELVNLTGMPIDDRHGFGRDLPNIAKRDAHSSRPFRLGPQ